MRPVLKRRDIGASSAMENDSAAFPRALEPNKGRSHLIRDTIAGLMKEAMKSGDKARVSALRLIMAALKDREIEARGTGAALSPADEMALFAKMVKTRQESLAIYQQAGRTDLADQEQSEITIISEFLPKQMDEAAVEAAIAAAIAETGAASIKDMGKVVAALKAKYPGQMDFAKASVVVKGSLTS
jgi:uncharacterized protein